MIPARMNTSHPDYQAYLRMRPALIAVGEDTPIAVIAFRHLEDGVYVDFQYRWCLTNLIIGGIPIQFIVFAPSASGMQ